MSNKPTSVRTMIASAPGAGPTAIRGARAVMPGHPAYGTAAAGARPLAVPAPNVAAPSGGVMPMPDYPHGRGGMAAVPMPASGTVSASSGSSAAAPQSPNRRGMPPAQRMPS